MPNPRPRVRLKRSIGLLGLLFFGMGTMVGAGFYALLGEVAGIAGTLTPVSFALAAGLALINGLTFAELSARYPVSAGVARYVAEGIGGQWAPGMTGWLVIATGVVSAATLSVATVGFLQDLLPVDRAAGLVAVVLGLGVLAAWGIGESVAFIGLITLIEVGALVVVFAFNAEFLTSWQPLSGGRLTTAEATGILGAAFLAFYAFIGFEDMVSVAEEVHEPERNMPRGILLAVLLTTILYLVVGIVAVAGPGPERLAASQTPVAELVSRLGGAAPLAIVIVSILTGINGALVQIIMASRVAYGMAGQADAPRWMGSVEGHTHTPMLATAAATAVVLILALLFPLGLLARTTSAIILVVFALVNLSLWRLKARETPGQDTGFRVPRWVPAVGLWGCVLVLCVEGWLRLTGSG